jgi:hypothetical protein
MKGGILLALTFALLHVLQQSTLHVFGAPWANIPLLVIAGIIVMQRVGIEEGVAWFLALSLLNGFDLYAFCWAVVGPIFLLRVFTTRSVYALIGLGIVAHTTVSACTLILEKIIHRFFDFSFIPVYHAGALAAQIPLLIPGLFLAIICIRFAEKNLFTRVYLRPS